jgi:hypothetical protein
MKYKYLLIVALFAPGCSDWLDIRPQLEIGEEEMFATEWGFQDVLIGAYTNIAAQSLYGQTATVIVPELLAQHWVVASSDVTYDNIRHFKLDEQSIGTTLSNMWMQYYLTIANLNSLLAAIDSRASLFVDGNYELIKGEALGLRAFLHFDLLRFWGDSPKDVNGDEITIPYMKVMTKDPNLLRSVPYDEVLWHLENDLDSAEFFLQNDPIRHYPPSVLNKPGVESQNGIIPPENTFHYYRQNRFNLYAVKATKARYYSWRGEKTRALQYAKEVIEAVDLATSQSIFTLANEATMQGGIASTSGISSSDLIMTSEHIFALHNVTLQSLLYSLFTTFSGLTQEKEPIRNAFEANIHPNDIRSKEPRNWEEKIDRNNLNEEEYKRYFLKKFLENDLKAVYVMPVIRLAEMYLIAIESAPLAEANNLLQTYRVSRNMESLVDGSLVSENTVYQRLEKEYRKEFYGEGQMFFFYKRHKVAHYSWPSAFPVDVAKYKFPKPEDQSIYE